MEKPDQADARDAPDALDTAQLDALARRLIAQGESEKAALARKMHDDLGACLTVATLDISVVAEKLKHSEPELAARLQRAIGQLKDAVKHKRRFVEELRPALLDGFGISACLDDFAQAFSRRTGLAATADLCKDFDGAAPELAIALFRIAAEALSNVERHAEAHTIHLSLREQGGFACLRIEDDGRGIDPAALLNPACAGLAAMRMHAAMQDGRLMVQGRHPENGSAVIALFPLPG